MNQTRILIIEDEKSVFKFLESFLESKGHKIFHAENGERGTQLAIENRPELIILDLGLPDVHGVEVLKKIRAWSEVPIIILTANHADEEKINALNLGADDYLTKPFNINELQARMGAVMRRTFKNEDSKTIEKYNLKIDLHTHSTYIKNELIHLTQTEFEILKLLILANGKIVTHRQLLNTIWGPNSVEHTQYLRVYVGQLRKKLQEKNLPQNIIITETGIGYRLNN